jgi:AcrR family transcriptional regulator
MATSRRDLPTITLRDPPPQGEVRGRIPTASRAVTRNSIIDRIEYRAMIDYASRIRTGGTQMAGKAGLATRPQDRMSRRSDPQQERSRARQRGLLDAAEEILGEVGADGLKMREVARRANLPIASVYHYFPSAPALIHTLVERMLDELRAILTQGVVRAEGASPGEAEHALVAIIDAAGDFMESRPTLPAVWGAMRGAPELRALDLADTEGNAQILAPAIGVLLSRASAEDVEALALVVIEGVWSALQLGCELPPEKRPRVRAMLKEFVAAALAGLMEKYR